MVVPIRPRRSYKQWFFCVKTILPYYCLSKQVNCGALLKRVCFSSSRFSVFVRIHTEKTLLSGLRTSPFLLIALLSEEVPRVMGRDSNPGGLLCVKEWATSHTKELHHTQCVTPHPDVRYSQRATPCLVTYAHTPWATPHPGDANQWATPHTVSYAAPIWAMSYAKSRK